MTKVTFLDRNGFVVALPTAVLVFDYARDPANALHKQLEANKELPVIFFASHHHGDHFNPAIFDLAQDRDRTFVLSYDIESKHVIDKGMEVAWLAPGDKVEDLPGGIAVKAFRVTGAGVSFVVSDGEGNKVFYGGDLNDVYKADPTRREEQKMDSQYEADVNRVASEFPEVTVAMLAVDTRDSLVSERGARIFLDKVKVDYFFPMHLNGRAEDACNFAAYNPRPGVTTCHCLARPGDHRQV